MLRGNLQLALLTSLFGFVSVSTAIAAESGYDPEMAGMPQFDPSSFPSQIFWLAVTFIILYVFFSKKSLPDISSILENRREHIQNDIETAEKLRKEAEDIQKAYEEKLDQAHQDAQRLYNKAEEKIKANADKAYDDFLKRAHELTEQTEKRIEREKASVKEDIDALAAEIAKDAAEKIIGISTNIDQARTAVQNISKRAA